MCIASSVCCPSNTCREHGERAYVTKQPIKPKLKNKIHTDISLMIQNRVEKVKSEQLKKKKGQTKRVNFSLSLSTLAFSFQTQQMLIAYS